MQITATAIIFGYNSAHRIAEILNCIALQNIPENVKLDVLLMDNASSDNLVATAQSHWKSLNVSVQLRSIYESKPGLIFSRITAIKECEADYLFFIDDDNYLEKDYFNEAISVFEKYSNVGVVCGELLPLFESTPPQWFYEHLHVLAIGKQGEKKGIVNNEKGYSWGAGMCIRRKVLDKLFDAGFNFTQLIYKNQLAGYADDYELSLFVRLAGSDIFYNPAMKLKHLVLSQKMNEPYLEKINFMQGLCSVITDAPLFHINKKKSKNNFVIWLREYFYAKKRTLKFEIVSSAEKKRKEKLIKIYYKGRIAGLKIVKNKAYENYFLRTQKIIEKLS